MKKGIELALGCLTALALGATASAAPQVPDVIAYDVGINGSDSNDIHYYGQNGGIAAYSFATQSCNAGTAPVLWFSSDTRHPVIAQNMFRYADGRFEQIGQSWLKHGFCAVNEIESQCAPCSSTNCDSLGVGCADTYWSTLNDGGSGRSKRFVNATSGAHTDNGIGPTGNSTIRGRLQVAVADIDPVQNPGAEYFIEGQYVTADDAAAGASSNNASWRRVNVNSVSSLNGGGPTARRESAIFAWQDQDPSVLIKQVVNLEGGGGKATFLVGCRVTGAGPGLWDYEYAIQNLTSDQSAGSFSVPVNPPVAVTDVGFHDVAYHSGDPYDGTDWTSLRMSGELRWSTVPYSTDPNANALRWGTLYNWRFIADSPPVSGPVTIGLFKPGPNTDLTVDDMLVPMAQPVVKRQQSGAPGSGGVVSVPITVGHNGSRLNPDVLSEISPAIVGREWRGRVEIAGLSESVFYVGTGTPGQVTLTRMGELLIQRPFLARLHTTEPVIAIPDDSALVGTTFSVQALALTRQGWQLTNALAVTIGTAQ